jgi:hypothetical protein
MLQTVCEGRKMARKPALHSADELIGPALERVVEAIDPPDSDDALVALARVLARTIDRMTDDQRAVMAGQTAPQMLRILIELEQRAAKRRKPPARQPSALDKLRQAHVAANRQRGIR